MKVVLETERLLLRHFTESDADALLRDGKRTRRAAVRGQKAIVRGLMPRLKENPNHFTTLLRQVRWLRRAWVLSSRRQVAISSADAA